VAAILAAVLAASCSAAPARTGAAPAGLRAQQLQVAAVWSGAEQRHFEFVLRAFARKTGVSVSYLSAGYSVPAFLQARLAAGRPPDVAFLPQPGLLRRYAIEHLLVPLDQIAGTAVADNFSPAWRRLGSSGGRLYGVWFKAANKSLIWYNIGVLERAGIVPPGSLTSLVPVEYALARSGTPAFAIGGADGWTLADWFSNLYLRMAGPAQYDLLAAHRIPWTDPSVKAALRLLAQVLAPRLIAGGPRRALVTSYQESVQETFARHPAAAMVFEGDFAAGVISAQTSAVPGADVDVAPFPVAGRAGPVVVAGGDAAVLMRRSAAGAAFIRYLASPQAAAIWAHQGGFVSPNINLALSVYPGAIDRSIARALLAAGPNFRFSLSDLVPASFGGTEGRGMRGILQRFLLHRDVGGTAAALEQAARDGYPR
jgi:ABC-type glycerol-3-phosphate transport system substrate-binding protein